MDPTASLHLLTDPHAEPDARQEAAAALMGWLGPDRGWLYWVQRPGQAPRRLRAAMAGRSRVVLSTWSRDCLTGQRCRTDHTVAFQPHNQALNTAARLRDEPWSAT